MINKTNTRPEEIEIRDGSLAEQILTEKADFGEWVQNTVKGHMPYLAIAMVFHIILFLFFCQGNFPGNC